MGRATTATTVVAAMTELRGRTARWSVAALAAPVAASLFAGTTAWATHHDPLHPVVTSTNPIAAAAPVADPRLADPSIVALRSALLANAKKVDALGRQVAAIQAQAAALAKGRSTSVRSSGGTTSSRSSSVTPRSSGGTSRPPLVITLPAPAAPPVTHTSTGASGAKP